MRLGDVLAHKGPTSEVRARPTMDHSGPAACVAPGPVSARGDERTPWHVACPCGYHAAYATEQSARASWARHGLEARLMGFHVVDGQERGFAPRVYGRLSCPGCGSL